MTYYLGLDPGVSGALAILNPDGKVSAVEDLPTVTHTVTTKKGPKERKRLDAPGLRDQIHELLDQNVAEVQAIIEWSQPFGRDGSIQAFSTGHSAGIIEGVICTLGLPYQFVKPKVWKDAMGLPADKDEVRREAIRRWSEVGNLLAFVKDHNRAEAIALADYLRRLDQQMEMN